MSEIYNFLTCWKILERILKLHSGIYTLRLWEMSRIKDDKRTM